MKVLFFLPLLIENFFRSMLLPRFLFLGTYAPSCEEVREADEQARNAIRKADYHAKKALWRDYD